MVIVASFMLKGSFMTNVPVCRLVPRFFRRVKRSENENGTLKGVPLIECLAGQPIVQ
tara:strand:- start:16135 stop:16305 length:171 start_codon:yes stop_codon:yes gene_type:complete